MNQLNEALFALSAFLLVPSLLALLASFLVCLWQAGRLGRQFVEQKRWRAQWTLLLTETDGLQQKNVPAGLSDPWLARLFLAPSTAERHYLLQQFELSCERVLWWPRNLIRLGPMLGLMGTLIPLGPALSGLANGALDTLASNMQIAFATTVMGVLIGGAAYLVYGLRKRWLHEQFVALAWLCDREESAAHAS